MPIPKIVHQTWKTYDLPEPSIKQIELMQDTNPEYKFVLYDDEAIDSFIKRYFDKEVYECFSVLNVGAAKADFWRYCILYKMGGIYLDIDSILTCNIDEIIKDTDEAVITREGNPYYFNQWVLIFNKKHPIMKKAIELCCENIKKRCKKSIIDITGPGLFTRAIRQTLQPYFLPEKVPNLYNMKDKDLNLIFDTEDSIAKCRFFGYDMNKKTKFKYPGFKELYNTNTHWSNWARLNNEDPRSFILQFYKTG